MDTTKIREHMPVVAQNNEQFGQVDRLEGNAIKLTKDQSGQHHWIPVSWVQRVDDKVYINRTGQQAMKEWLASPPEGTRF